jgi:hypothetical protein
VDDDDAVDDDDSGVEPDPADCSECGDGCTLGATASPGLLAGLLLLPALVLSRRRRPMERNSAEG